MEKPERKVVPFRTREQIQEKDNLLERIKSEAPEERLAAFVEYFRTRGKQFPLQYFTDPGSGKVSPLFFQTLDTLEDALQTGEAQHAMVTPEGDWEDMQAEIDAMREYDPAWKDL